MSRHAALTETFLSACRRLGRVRVVHRNGVGLSEIFTDLDKLEVGSDGANLVLPHAHLHLTPKSFGAAAFRSVESEHGASAPAVWLYGAEGCPLLLFVLDQTKGDSAREQWAAYRQLRCEYGPFVHLMSRRGAPAVTPRAPDERACPTLH